MGNIQGSYMEFGPVVQKMSFKDISGALAAFSSADSFVQFW